jgi:hypothetical protein
MTTKGIWQKPEISQSSDSANNCDCHKDDNNSADESCASVDTNESRDTNESNESIISDSSYELTFGEKLIHFFIRIISIITLPMHLIRFIALFVKCLFNAVLDSEHDSDCYPSTTMYQTTECETTPEGYNKDGSDAEYDHDCLDLATNDLSIGPASDADCESMELKN